MVVQKDGEFSFATAPKESIQGRLKKLMKGRSLRKVAADWGFPYSTLNNYFTKDTMPGVDVIMRVAEVEQVSLEWLILGTGDEQQAQQAQQGLPSGLEPDMQAIVAILMTLESEERSKLAKLLGRKGAEVLALLLEQGGLDLLKLSGEQRTAALSLQELPTDRVREILLAIKQCSTLTEEVNYKHQASA